MPVITDEFDSLKDVGWYSSVYFMTTAITQLLYGRLYTRYPIKYNYSVAMFFFLVGSALCGAAPNSPALIVGRALAGIGCSGLLVGTFSLVPYIAHPTKQPLFMGLIGGTMGIGYATGPLIGGAFTEHVTWRWNVSGIPKASPPRDFTSTMRTFFMTFYADSMPVSSSTSTSPLVLLATPSSCSSSAPQSATPINSPPGKTSSRPLICSACSR